MSISTLSVVIPCYRSAATIGPTVEGIAAALAPRHALQFVLVNDGSADDTWERLAELHEARDDVVAVNLTRNFGEHNAVITGLRYTTGDAVIIVDDDLQHPPEEILKLLAPLEEGADVVYGRYQEKQHSLVRNLGSWLNGFIAGWVLDKPSGLYLSSFKAIRGDIARQVATYDGPFVYLDGLLFWTTNRVEQVIVGHQSRTVGHSNYNFRRLVRLHLNLLTGFSVRPLRVASLFGFVIAAVGLGLAVDFAFEKLRNPHLQVGWASLIVTVLVIGGVNLVMLGLVGEYVGRIFLRLNHKPQSVVREVLR